MGLGLGRFGADYLQGEIKVLYEQLKTPADYPGELGFVRCFLPDRIIALISGSSDGGRFISGFS